MICQWCKSEYHDAILYPGTCGNCGGPKSILPASEEEEYYLELDIYGSYFVTDKYGKFVRVASEEDKIKYGKLIPIVSNGVRIATFIQPTYP